MNFGPFSRKQVKEAFESFDLDGNKFIGAAELRTVYEAIGEHVTDEEIDEMLAMVDTDGDGQVSLPEFTKMVFKYAPRTFGDESSEEDADEAVKKGDEASFMPMSVNNQKRRWELKEAMTDAGLAVMDLTTLRHKFRAFEKDELDFGEFCELVELPRGPQADRIFSLFDVDCSNTVSSKEVMVGFCNFLDASKQDRIRFAFEMFDEDNSGFISYEELIKILKANYLAVHEKQVQRKAQTILRRADQDGDNVISYEEFVQVCEKYPNLVFPSLTAPQGRS